MMFSLLADMSTPYSNESSSKLYKNFHSFQNLLKALWCVLVLVKFHFINLSKKVGNTTGHVNKIYPYFAAYTVTACILNVIFHFLQYSS